MLTWESGLETQDVIPGMCVLTNRKKDRKKKVSGRYQDKYSELKEDVLDAV